MSSLLATPRSRLCSVYASGVLMWAFRAFGFFSDVVLFFIVPYFSVVFFVFPRFPTGASFPQEHRPVISPNPTPPTPLFFFFAQPLHQQPPDPPFRSSSVFGNPRRFFPPLPPFLYFFFAPIFSVLSASYLTIFVVSLFALCIGFFSLNRIPFFILGLGSSGLICDFTIPFPFFFPTGPLKFLCGFLFCCWRIFCLPTPSLICVCPVSLFSCAFTLHDSIPITFQIFLADFYPLPPLLLFFYCTPYLSSARACSYSANGLATFSNPFHCSPGFFTCTRARVSCFPFFSFRCYRSLLFPAPFLYCPLFCSCPLSKQGSLCMASGPLFTAQVNSEGTPGLLVLL